MAEKKLYKLIATIIAISIYLFFVYTFVQLVKERENKVKDYGFNVDEAIVVELETKPDKNPIVEKKPKPNPQPKETQTPKELPKPVVNEIVKEEMTPTKEEEKKPDVPKPKVEKEIKAVEAKEEKPKEQEARDKEAKSAKDLFSTLRTKDYDKVMEERVKQEEKRASRLAKQKAAKQKQEEQKRKRAQALSAAKAILQDIKPSSSTSHKKRGEKDDFWSPVSSKIMAKWNRTISTQDGLKAVVKIRIDNSGRLTYRVRRLSNNPLFDTKLKIFLENLEYDRFPGYRGGSYIEADFVFKDQAE